MAPAALFATPQTKRSAPANSAVQKFEDHGRHIWDKASDIPTVRIHDLQASPARTRRVHAPRQRVLLDEHARYLRIGKELHVCYLLLSIPSSPICRSSGPITARSITSPVSVRDSSLLKLSQW